MRIRRLTGDNARSASGKDLMVQFHSQLGCYPPIQLSIQGYRQVRMDARTRGQMTVTGFIDPETNLPKGVFETHL